MYDLLIKGGRVIDPAQNIDAQMDVAINGDKIAIVARDISPQEGQQVIEASGRIVTPGLIDLHCHAAGSLLTMSVDPDVAGVMQGVTTVVDGGSTGEAMFGGFPRYVIPSSRTRIFCFLHLSSQGLTIMPELRDWEEVNLEGIAATIDTNKELIKGVKLRLVGNTVARDGIKVVETAKKAARQFGMPIMIHIGDLKKQVPPDVTRQTLSSMEASDILSHVFTAKSGSAFQSNGTALPELRAAMERGVILDTAIGKNNFNFEVARRGIAQGILPTTISTDLGGMNLKGPVYGQAVTMSKFLELGLELKQVVAMSTINPARALGEDSHIGSLKAGMEADVSILEIQSGKWKLEDSEQQILEVNKLLAPVMTVKAGAVIPAQPATRPQPAG
jgi:dihydroorotase